ncbi:SDR family NAD(P)-dependent oxidoreductase [Paenibacillus periandrae]|uniref:SDR family NAD(P)-dependent oxidoreductase n=1 Tax=Paenibacillus periandrae TaxID=1761741 RepID=UPI001F095B77|nr:SDR family oxidoreductase [Paenibacillus periandrae]
MDNPFRLDGKLALITGGGTGLGLGMSHAIVNAGGRVVITGRREDRLKSACEELGSSSVYVPHDITQLKTIPGLVQKVEEQFGPIEILINNAGIHLKSPVQETTDEGFSQVLQTHVQGGFSLTRECAAHMVRRGSGSIVFITSMSALLGIPNVIAYTAAKTAVSGMVRGLASELSPHGIRVNSIAPGWIDSSMTRKAFEGDPERERKILSRTPMGCLGTAEDIGHAAVYLCSPAARFVTGVDLRIDGGAGIGF